MPGINGSHAVTTERGAVIIADFFPQPGPGLRPDRGMATIRDKMDHCLHDFFTALL
jgi:hypothetical protein